MAPPQDQTPQSLDPSQQAVQRLVADPKFRAQSASEQRMALQLATGDKEFAQMPDADVQDFIRSMGPGAPQQTMAPPPSFWSPAGQREAMYKLADIGTKALPAVGGTIGGIAGTGAEPAFGTVAGAGVGGMYGKLAEQWARKGIFNEPAPGTLGEELATVGGEGGMQALGEVLGMGFGKVGKWLLPVDRVNLLAFGTRSGQLGERMGSLMPELDKAAAQVGRPRNIGDMEKLIQTANTNLDNEFNQALFPIAQQPVVAHQVAQSIVGQVTPNMAKTAEGRAMQRYLVARAREFEQGTWTIGQLNQERMLITRRLRAFKAAEASGQAAQKGTRAAIAADTAAERALKDMLYSAADHSGAKPPGYFTALKQKQSALIDFTDAVQATKEKLTKASMESKGAPLYTKLHIRAHATPANVSVGGLSGINLAAFADPLKQANRRIQLAFPEGVGDVGTRAVRTGIGKALTGPTGAGLGARTLRDVRLLPLRALWMMAADEPLPEDQIRRLAEERGRAINEQLQGAR